MFRLARNVAIALTAIAAPATAADFSWAEIDTTPGHARVVMLGDVVPGDAAELERMVHEANRSGLIVSQVRLYSNGGSLSEGLALGRVIRHYRLFAEAPSGPYGNWQIVHCRFDAASDSPRGNNVEDESCACNSACALAWLGGLYRQGSVGIHRAYLVDGEAGYDVHEEAVAGSAREISAYLDEMRVPSFVYDRILTTDSARLSFLSDAEREQIRYDPVFSEFLTARCGSLDEADEDLHWELFYRRAFGEGLSRTEELAFQRLAAAARVHGACVMAAHSEAAAEVQLR